MKAACVSMPASAGSRGGEVDAGHDVLGGVRILFGGRSTENVLCHGAMEQGRRDRVLVGKSVGRRAEDRIVAAVEVFAASPDEPVRLIEVAPLDKEPQRPLG